MNSAHTTMNVSGASGSIRRAPLPSRPALDIAVDMHFRKFVSGFLVIKQAARMESSAWITLAAATTML